MVDRDRNSESSNRRLWFRAASTAVLCLLACGAPIGAAEPNLPRDAGLADEAVATGPYLDWRKWTPVFALFLLWVWTLRRIDVDAGALRLGRRTWNAGLFTAGLLGFLIAFNLPSYWTGYVVLLLAYSVPVGLYVTARNVRVDEDRRLFTVEHLRRLPRDVGRGIARLLPGGSAEAAGPAVVLLGKSITSAGEGERGSKRAENSRARRAARELIYETVTRNATDVHLEPTYGGRSGERIVSVRLRIDGLLKPADPFDDELGSAVVNIFKILSALDITDKRRSQDGSFQAEVNGVAIDVRVATQGTQFGEKLSLRILDSTQSLRDLASLGMRKQMQERVRECIQRRHGMLLVAGPTGAGKTTTLYASLREIDTRERNVITVEDPIEYRLSGVNQIEINTKAGQTFEGALRNLLRQDPDVLLIGEIRDAETAKIACEAATTGHVVLSTIHANDAVAALYRLTELGVEPYIVESSVTAVLAQRLVRRLCTDCRQAFQPSRELLERLGLPGDRAAELYRPPSKFEADCTTCNATGYSGRSGVFELLELTPDVRKLIRRRAPADEVFAAARNEGLLTLQEEGLGLIVRGVTSVEELFQVVGTK